MSNKNKIKKILLINPPAIIKNSWLGNVKSFPLGLAYIAATLKQNNFEVEILDCIIEGYYNRHKVNNQLIRIGMSDIDIIKKINQYSPEIVGISIQFSCQLYSALKVNSIIKSVNINIITVAGGNHVSGAAESIDNGTFNWLIIGEGEYRLLNLIKAINNQILPDTIQGVIAPSGVIPDKSNKKNDFIENLDFLPFPLYNLLPLKKYWQGNRRWINMMATRGCPYNCVFCSIKTTMGKKVRYRSVNNVLEEIILLKNKFSVEQIYFEDDNLTFDMQWSKELFNRIIKENLGLEIFLRNGIRADKVDLELLGLMQKAGVQRVWFAPESGSQKTLDKIIKKKMKLEDCENAIYLAKKIGLDVTCFLIIGFPEETMENIRQTIRYGHKLKKIGSDNIWVSCAVPYPGTELFNECVNKGIISLKNIDYQSMSTVDSIIYNSFFTTIEIKDIRDQAMHELNQQKLGTFNKLKSIQRRVLILFSNPVLFFKKLIAYIKKHVYRHNLF